MLEEAIKVIMVPDWDKVDPEIIELLKTGHMHLREGVIYWAKGKKLSEGAGSIVKHLPFKEMTVDVSQGVNVEQLMKATAAMQKSIGLAVGLSTGIILAAIVIQTAYLSQKLNKIQASIDKIAVEIQTQNQLFYLEKLSSYMGSIMAAHEMLAVSKESEAYPEVIAPLLATLAQQRNELCTFLMNLIGWIDHSKAIENKITDEHAALIVDFVTSVLDVMPKSIYVESALYTILGKYHHADALVESAAIKYKSVLNSYRLWAKVGYDKWLTGKASRNSRLLVNKFEDINSLLRSIENQLLLGNSQQLCKQQLEYVVTP